MNYYNIFLAATLAFSAGEASAFPFSNFVHAVVDASQPKSASTQVPSKGHIDVAFSPNEGANELVIRAINSVQKNTKGEILILSYSFTSADITKALLDVRRRGVTVRLVADYKNNIAQDRSGKAKAALSALAEAGVDVRTIKAFPIHHDKVMIVDRKTVELGSFNFSYDAAHKNSENVFVNWDNPDLANVYLRHFKRNYDLSDSYIPRY